MLLGINWSIFPQDEIIYGHCLVGTIKAIN